MIVYCWKRYALALVYFASIDFTPQIDFVGFRQYCFIGYLLFAFRVKIGTYSTNITPPPPEKMIFNVPSPYLWMHSTNCLTTRSSHLSPKKGKTGFDRADVPTSGVTESQELAEKYSQ